MQLLPILAPKLSYFEIFFRQGSELGDGILSVTLRVEPSAQDLQSWKVRYDEIRDGWNTFAPPPIVIAPNEVVLELTWSTPIGAPTVGLSTSCWDVSYRAVLPGGDHETRSLAMRIWSGIPGVTPPSLPARFLTATAEISELMPGQLVTMPANFLLGATQHHYGATIRRDYPSVLPDETKTRLIVHPHEEVATIAIIPDLPTGTTFISAECRTIHDNANPIEYAMAIAPPKLEPESIFADAVGPSEYCTGWHSLNAMTARRINLRLNRPTAAGDRLFLATRLPPGGSEAYAWASWAALEIGIGWQPPETAEVVQFLIQDNLNVGVINGGDRGRKERVEAGARGTRRKNKHRGG